MHKSAYLDETVVIFAKLWLLIIKFSKDSRKEQRGKQSKAKLPFLRNRFANSDEHHPKLFSRYIFSQKRW